MCGDAAKGSQLRPTRMSGIIATGMLQHEGANSTNDAAHIQCENKLHDW